MSAEQTAVIDTTDLDALNAYDLAKMADVAAPADWGSPGATFLLGVRDSLTNRLELDGWPTEDGIQELCGDAVPGFISQRWAIFTDLRGWQVDTTDVTGGYVRVTELSEHAATVLSLLAERVIERLLALLPKPE